METPLTFDPKYFLSFQIFVISPALNKFLVVSYFFLEPTSEYNNSMFLNFVRGALWFLNDLKFKLEYFHSNANYSSRVRGKDLKLYILKAKG